MKKLNLQLGSIKEMLTKEEMKKITGGYGSGSGGGGGSQAVQCMVQPDNFSYICTTGGDITCSAECARTYGPTDCSCYTISCHGHGQHVCG